MIFVLFVSFFSFLLVLFRHRRRAFEPKFIPYYITGQDSTSPSPYRQSKAWGNLAGGNMEESNLSSPPSTHQVGRRGQRPARAARHFPLAFCQHWHTTKKIVCAINEHSHTIGRHSYAVFFISTLAAPFFLGRGFRCALDALDSVWKKARTLYG